MKKFSIILCLIIVLTLFNATRKADFSVRAKENKSVWKTRLFDIFCLLDIEKIISSNKMYLDSIGADFDQDNKYYFVEPKFSGSGITDECFIFLEPKTQQEAKITIFPSESEPDIWLKARVSIKNGKLVCSLIFEPGFFNEEYLKIIRPLNTSQHYFASIPAAE